MGQRGEFSASKISEQLEKICSHPLFTPADARKRLLSFLVQGYVAGNVDGFSQYELVLRVLKPLRRTQSDHIDDTELANLRQQMKNLRSALDRYYKDAGYNDELLIDVPNAGGSGYRATVSRRDTSETSPDFHQTAKLIPLTTIDGLPDIQSIDPQKLLAVLEPQYRALPLLGRHSERDTLWTWLEVDPRPVSFHVVVGHGGLGKTRLAIGLLELLKERCPDRWHAGFLAGADRCREHLTYSRFQNWRGRKTLVIVDNAAVWADELAEVIRGIRAGREPEQQIRFLLIDRGAHPDAGWFGKLRSATGLLVEKYFPRQPTCLSPFGPEASGLSQRLQFLDKALAAISAVTKEPSPPVTEAAKQRLAAPELGDPLVLFMAAFRAHQIGDLAPLTWRKLDLAEGLARNEMDRIKGLSREKSEFLPLHMAAYVTLTDGLSRDALNKACEEEIRELRDPRWISIELAEFVEFQALPSSQSLLAAAPILPDLIGEALILRVFLNPYQSADDTVPRAFALKPRQVLFTLVRMVQDWGRSSSTQVLSEQRRILEWLARVLCEASSTDEHLLEDVDAALPIHSVAMMQLARDFYHSILNIEHLSPGIRAVASLSLARWEKMLGNDESAASHSLTAAQYYQKVAVTSGLFYRASIVALCQHAGDLSDLRRHAQAIEISRESVRLSYRFLRAHRGQEHRAVLVGAILKYEHILDTAGSTGANRRLIRIALRHSLRLVNSDRQRFLQLLVESLDSEARLAMQRNAVSKAIESSEQALNYAIELAHDNPDVWLGTLQSAYYRRAGIHKQCKEWPKAIELFNAQITTLDRMAVYGRNSNLLFSTAGAYAHLGDVYWSNDQHSLAKTAYEQAIALYHEAMHAMRQRVLGNLPMCLANLARLCILLRDVPRGLTAVEETLRYFRELFDTKQSTGVGPERGVVATWFPGALQTKATLLAQKGSFDEAIGVNNEALDLTASLLSDNPRLRLPELAESLHLRGWLYAKKGDVKAAADAFLSAFYFIKPCAIAEPLLWKWKAAVSILSSYTALSQTVARDLDIALWAPFLEPKDDAGPDLCEHKVRQTPMERLSDVIEYLSRGQSSAADWRFRLMQEARTRLSQLQAEEPQSFLKVLQERVEVVLAEARAAFDHDDLGKAAGLLQESGPTLMILEQERPATFESLLVRQEELFAAVFAADAGGEPGSSMWIFRVVQAAVMKR